MLDDWATTFDYCLEEGECVRLVVVFHFKGNLQAWTSYRFFPHETG